jgi:hypothetical protein
MTQEIITGQIAEYNPFRQQVAEMVKNNQATVFDYESDKGEKEARSYVYKLRQSKTAIDKKRKELGEDLVTRKRMIDSEAKTLIETVEGMIDVHMKPLEKKAEREARRVADIEVKMQELKQFRQIPAHETSDFLRNAIESFNDFVVDDSFAERLPEAIELQARAAEFLTNSLSAAIQREKDAAELAALRDAQALQAERDRIAKEAKDKQDEADRIKREADERAQKEANAAAQKLIDEANAATRKAEAEAAKVKVDAEKAESDRIATAKAKADKEAAEKTAADKKEAERQANVTHRKTVNNAAKDALVSNGLDADTAQNVVKLIASGLVPNVTINY